MNMSCGVALEEDVVSSASRKMWNQVPLETIKSTPSLTYPVHDAGDPQNDGSYGFPHLLSQATSSDGSCIPMRPMRIGRMSLKNVGLQAFFSSNLRTEPNILNRQEQLSSNRQTRLIGKCLRHVHEVMMYMRSIPLFLQIQNACRRRRPCGCGAHVSNWLLKECISHALT